MPTSPHLALRAYQHLLLCWQCSLLTPGHKKQPAASPNDTLCALQAAHAQTVNPTPSHPVLLLTPLKRPCLTLQDCAVLQSITRACQQGGHGSR